MFAIHCKHAEEVPEPVREHRFHAERRWRFDFAWPDKMIAVEVEGLVWRGIGRHQSAEGYRKDLEKYNAALLDGWKVLRYDQKAIKDGSALAGLCQLLAQEQG
jgi:very-short-patch-repair endonuclease